MQSEFDQDVPKDDQGGSAGSDGLTVIKWIKMAVDFNWMELKLASFEEEEERVGGSLSSLLLSCRPFLLLSSSSPS